MMHSSLRKKKIRVILKHGTTTEECECRILHKQKIGKLLKKYRRFYGKKIDYKDCCLFDYSAHANEVISLFRKAYGFDNEPQTLIIYEKSKMNKSLPDKFIIDSIPKEWVEKGCHMKLLLCDTMLGEVILDKTE